MSVEPSVNVSDGVGGMSFGSVCVGLYGIWLKIRNYWKRWPFSY